MTFAFEGEGSERSLVVDFKVVGQKKTVGSVLSYSFRKAASVGRLVWISLLDLVTGHASLNDLSGPIGMTKVVGEAAKVGADSFFLLVAFITINVGIFNLLPLPALDGGRLIFLLLEAVPWEAGEVGARRACPCHWVCAADPFDGGRSSQRYF